MFICLTKNSQTFSQKAKPKRYSMLIIACMRLVGSFDISVNGINDWTFNMKEKDTLNINLPVSRSFIIIHNKNGWTGELSVDGGKAIDLLPEEPIIDINYPYSENKRIIISATEEITLKVSALYPGQFISSQLKATYSIFSDTDDKFEIGNTRKVDFPIATDKKGFYGVWVVSLTENDFAIKCNGSLVDSAITVCSSGNSDPKSFSFVDVSVRKSKSFFAIFGIMPHSLDSNTVTATIRAVHKLPQETSIRVVLDDISGKVTTLPNNIHSFNSLHTYDITKKSHFYANNISLYVTMAQEVYGKTIVIESKEDMNNDVIYRINSPCVITITPKANSACFAFPFSSDLMGNQQTKKVIDLSKYDKFSFKNTQSSGDAAFLFVAPFIHTISVECDYRKCFYDWENYKLDLREISQNQMACRFFIVNKLVSDMEFTLSINSTKAVNILNSKTVEIKQITYPYEVVRDIIFYLNQNYDLIFLHSFDSYEISVSSDMGKTYVMNKETPLLSVGEFTKINRPYLLIRKVGSNPIVSFSIYKSLSGVCNKVYVVDNYDYRFRFVNLNEAKSDSANASLTDRNCVLFPSIDLIKYIMEGKYGSVSFGVVTPDDYFLLAGEQSSIVESNIIIFFIGYAYSTAEYLNIYPKRLEETQSNFSFNALVEFDEQMCTIRNNDTEFHVYNGPVDAATIVLIIIVVIVVGVILAIVVTVCVLIGRDCCCENSSSCCCCCCSSCRKKDKNSPKSYKMNNVSQSSSETEDEKEEAKKTYNKPKVEIPQSYFNPPKKEIPRKPTPVQSFSAEEETVMYDSVMFSNKNIILQPRGTSVQGTLPQQSFSAESEYPREPDFA